MERWSIDLYKEDFKFSAAHFLIFPDGSAERLHGHNYRVSVEVEGLLSPHGLVIDFKRVKPLVRAICDELDEHLLVPGQHPVLTVEQRSDGVVEIHYRERYYAAPHEEVLVLPLNNTSAENLAAYVGRLLHERLRERFGDHVVRRLRVAVEETAGQRGVFTFEGEGPETASGGSGAMRAPRRQMPDRSGSRDPSGRK